MNMVVGVGRDTLLNIETKQEQRRRAKNIKKIEDETGEFVRLSPMERESLIVMLPMLSALHQINDNCGALLARAHGARKRLRTSITMLDNVFHDIFTGNIPIDQKMGIKHDAQYIHWRIGTYPETKEMSDKYGIFFSNKEAEIILNATHDHCLMCMANTQQQRQCKLRKALGKMVTYGAGKDDFKMQCPYMGMGD